jgi:hypothetical protein
MRMQALRIAAHCCMSREPVVIRDPDGLQSDCRDRTHLYIEASYYIYRCYSFRDVTFSLSSLQKHHIRLILSSCIAPARSAISTFRILLNRMTLIGTFGRIACRTDVWLQCRFLPYPWSICYERDRGSKAESRRTCCLSERVGHTVERQGRLFDRLQVEGCPTYTVSAVK